MISNSYLLRADGVHGAIEEKGIRLHRRRISKRSWPSWEEIRSIRRKLTPPVGSYYVLTLKDDTEARLDLLPFRYPSEACAEMQRRITNPDVPA
jgi:hypothetical protein